jgi:hypothetical protein|tara:strand:+ start:179 stop:391 length:213 start_codon:yes stop_codon:yes gene_type:complete
MKQFPKYDYRKQKPIDTEYTLECPECGYMMIGFEPRIVTLCNPCLEKIFKHNKNSLEIEKRKQDARKKRG